MKVAIITGSTGQDGSYLVDLLLNKNYKIKCPIRRSSRCDIPERLCHSDIEIFNADVTDQASLVPVFNSALREHPDVIEVYNLAAQSHVGVSFSCPASTFEINTNGTLNLLETIRQLGLVGKCRFYQASTSEMFGKVQEVPQTEQTPFYPRSPYGVAKLASHWLVKNYRESYSVFACSGILFNHESPRRGKLFVTQKIVMGLNDIMNGKLEYIELGNLDAKRDWGHAKDYVNGMWLMLQQDHPDDYVISMGETRSVREFAEIVVKHHGDEMVWEGEGIDEIGKLKSDGRVIIKISSKFYRPCEVDLLIGDCSKIKNIGWEPEFTFEDLVKDMVNNINN